MDLQRIRDDAPATRHQAFLHSAGSSLMPDVVVDTMTAHLRLEQRIGGYAAADQQQERLDAVYDSVAALVGGDRDEIALVENATVGWQMAFYSLPWRAGDRILTSRSEYAANYVAYLQVARRFGVVVDVIPDDSSGAVDPGALRDMIDDRVRLVSISWIPTNGGLTNPAAAIGAITRAAGIPYLLDACQAVGQLPIDVRALGCDILTGTGRKFLRGPRGTGFVYVRRGLLQTLEPPMIDHFAAPWTATDTYTLRPDARRFETWENNYAARLGLGAAVDYAQAVGLHEIGARARLLADRLREGLRSIPAVVLHDLGRDPCAIVSFSVRDRSVAAVLADAAAADVVIGASPPASTRLDSEARGLGYVLRASPHYFNIEDDVDRLVDLCAAAR